jgi:predicted phosphodiesterase
MNLAAEIAGFKPLVGVAGNCDNHDLRFIHPLHRFFECEGMKILMTHIGGYPGNYDASIRAKLFVRPPRLFISGHSHILKVKFDKTLNLLHINPGSAGKYGWHKTRTLVRFAIDNGEFKDLEVIELAE